MENKRLWSWLESVYRILIFFHPDDPDGIVSVSLSEKQLQIYIVNKKIELEIGTPHQYAY